MSFFEAIKRFFLADRSKPKNPPAEKKRANKLDPRFFSIMGGGKGPLMRKRRKYGSN